ncbi:MAG: AAA family ATPase [Isosphaeraceae bacterium]|nr:AAA family ATPase [Isosphaeraceae bacterium]
MSVARYQTAADLLGAWRDALLSGEAPVLYPVGDGELGRLEIGPGLVTLIGGAPGTGKTTLVAQLAIEALQRTPDLRALICNVEMPPSVLLDRQLARLAGIDASDIRHRRLGARHAEAIERGLSILESLADRLAFVQPPFDLANVAAAADNLSASLLVIDYIQRVAPPGEHGDRRGAVDATMSYLRQFADAGTALIVISAVGRSRDSRGRSTYVEGLNLASFRESSELEFGADDAFILVPEDDGDDGPPGRLVLRHLKARHGEPRDIRLTFDRRHQRFTADAPTAPQATDPGKLQAALRMAWARTRPAPEEEDTW